MRGLCLAQAHMALDLLLLVDETFHLSREIMINAKDTHKRQRKIHCRWGIYEKFDSFGGSYVRSYVNFSPFYFSDTEIQTSCTLSLFQLLVQASGDLLLFNRAVMSNTLWPRGLHHARLPDLHHLQNLLKLMSFESVMPSNHLILCHPLLLPSVLPNIRVFSDKSALHIRWPKYWNFSFSISPSNGYSGLISFRIDCFDLLAVRGTLKHLIQHRSSKASILQLLAFYIVQLLHPNMTTGKTITLTIQTFVSKVMSLLFNMLSRFVITFLPRSNYLPIFLAWESSAHSFKWQFRCHFSGESSLTTENWASCPSLHVH